MKDKFCFNINKLHLVVLFSDYLMSEERLVCFGFIQYKKLHLVVMFSDYSVSQGRLLFVSVLRSVSDKIFFSDSICCISVDMLFVVVLHRSALH